MPGRNRGFECGAASGRVGRARIRRKAKRVGLECLGRGHRLHQRLNRCDDHTWRLARVVAAFPTIQVCAHAQAFRFDLATGGALAGKRFPGREQIAGFTQEQLEVLTSGVGLVEVSGEIQNRV